MNVAFVYMNNERNVGRGAGYVAGAVVAEGHDLEFFDTFYTPVRKVAAEVVRGDYDLLMVSTMSMLFPEALDLCQRVKARSKTPILMGGVHPTIVGQRLLEEHEAIDFLCLGEGETMAADFLRHWGRESLYDVLNLAYRRDGCVRSNPVRPPEDLSKAPPFPWHFFPRKSVVQQGPGFLYINATRGCPYNCTYCCNGVYLKHYGKDYLRFRPIPDVIEEMEVLDRTYRPALFYFGDEMILSDTDYALALFSAIRDRMGVPYGCMARVEYMQPETVAAMAATGCRYVGMGIECGDETFRREHLNRRMSNTSIEAAFDLVKKAGIFVTSFNMIGYPFPNDPALTEATLRLNERIRPDFAQISIFYPFPGTELYRHCVENDLIDTERMAQAREYFSESVLKGVSLAATKRRLETRLNPHGLRFSMKGPQVAQGDSQGRADAETPPAPLPAGPKTARVLMLSPDHLMIDRRILQEARSLAREGLTVNVVSGLECPKEEHYEEGGVSVHRYSFRGAAGRSSRAARAIAQAVPQWGPLAHLAARLERWAVPRSAAGRFARQCAEQFPADVVHVHDLPLLWLGARLAKQWNAALVYDAHEIYWVHGSFSPAMQKALAREERAYAGRIDLFITVNQAIADYFEGLYHQRPLVLMNCAESPPPGDRAEIRRRLRAAAGIPGDSKVVLYQGWFSPERNLATLVRAAERLPQGAYLLMIGYGDYEKELRAIAVAARSGDKVRFLGRIEADDLLAFTAGADLGVIPYQPVDLNHRLCSPNKFFEYVQSGVPVVAQDLPFFHQMQQDHGVVSVGDLSTIEGMAGAINSLLADEPRLEAMRLACRRAAETINWETEARKLVEAYRAMLDRRRG